MNIKLYTYNVIMYIEHLSNFKRHVRIRGIPLYCTNCGEKEMDKELYIYKLNK
jgi:hypothetical protein